MSVKKNVFIRFNEDEFRQLTRMLDPSKKIATQIKDKIFTPESKSRLAAPSIDTSDLTRAISELRSFQSDLTAILRTIVVGLESLEDRQGMLIKKVDNIQDYLAAESEGEE